jgi:adenosylmethionine-8-amino-7-oxononanoate aminotransferase
MTATHTTGSPATVQQDLRDHLLLNFTDYGFFKDREIPVFVKGEGCHVTDVHGRTFIDGLSGLFCTNLGHSYGTEVGQAAARQLSELVYTPTWVVAHPGAVRVAERIAGHAPEGMEHVYFVNSGSEAVESAWKIARQYHAANGEPERRKAIARRYAYHGTTLGALSFTGYPEARNPFEPLGVPTHHVSNTNSYRHPLADDEAAFCAMLLAEVEEAIVWEGPSTVAMMIAEPVQNSGGAYMPPAGYWAGLREICDRYGVLLVADEVITGFGRVGHWFASERFGVVPDMITFAKGATGGHAPLGGVVLHGRVAETFTSGRAMFAHGATWSGHPLSTAIADVVLDIYEREDIPATVRGNEDAVRGIVDTLRPLPFVGDVRGAGYFFAVELVKDKATAEYFTSEEANVLLKRVLSDKFIERGLLCRLDDRDQPVIQLSPPLVADLDLWGQIVGIIGDSLVEAAADVERDGLLRG